MIQDQESGLYLVDRSRTAVDNECMRKRYWGYEYAGVGLAPAGDSEFFAFGTAFHEGIQQEEAGQARDVAYALMLASANALKMQEPLRTELPILVGGLAYAFVSRLLGHALMSHVVANREVECHFDMGGIRWMSKPDLVLRREADNTLWYWELKTSGAYGDTFCRQWEHKIQSHWGAKAYEATSGDPIEGILIQGALKGAKYKGHMRSRLVGAYARDGVPGMTKPAYSLKYKKGFSWFLSPEYEEGGQAGWIDQLPNSEIQEAFPVVPPRVPDTDMMDRWLQQHAVRERAIGMLVGDQVEMDEPHIHRTDPVGQKLMLEVFPQNDDACISAFGHSCAFYEACWNKTVGRDPIGSGMFVPRTPHHEPEAKALKERDSA